MVAGGSIVGDGTSEFLVCESCSSCMRLQSSTRRDRRCSPNCGAVQHHAHAKTRHTTHLLHNLTKKNNIIIPLSEFSSCSRSHILIMSHPLYRCVNLTAANDATCDAKRRRRPPECIFCGVMHAQCTLHSVWWGANVDVVWCVVWSLM